MRILYLAFIRLPTEKAHGLQIMKVCEALADAGAEVELALPGRTTPITENPFSYYGVKENFRIKDLHTPDLIRFSVLGFILSQILLGRRALRLPADAVISQDEWALLPQLLAGRNCVYEVHNGRWGRAARYAARKSVLIVANSEGTKRFYVEHGIAEGKIAVFPNGVDLERFNPSATVAEAREQLGLPQDKRIVLYTGHLYDWKGADTLAESASELPEGTEVIFVGGTERDVKAFRAKYGAQKNIHILGHKPNNEMPLYMRATDVLALPNARVGESEQFTSPMKLFEYLAAGKPIVASDLPSVREVVDESSVFFFTPGDPAALAETLRTALTDSEEAVARAGRAREKAAKYTWNRQTLLERLTHLL